MEEIFDVVNENDEVIGRATRKEVHEKGLPHRAVVLFFVKGENLILQRRSQRVAASKGALGVSVGGHVLQGEDYIDALIRECKEETGLAIQAQNLRELGRFYSNHRGAYGDVDHLAFHKIYVHEFNGEINQLMPDKEEVIAYEEVPVAKVFSPDFENEKYSLALTDEQLVRALKKYYEEKNV